MKLNGGQSPISPKQPAQPQTVGNSGKPAAGASPEIGAAPSARQQLARLKLANRETVLAKVADILHQKGGSHELLLELRGQSLKVNAGQRPPDLSVGDLIKVMRAGNELQLIGKLAGGQESSVARALAQRLPWQQNLQAGLAQLFSALQLGLKSPPQPGQLPSTMNAQPLPAAAQQVLQNLINQLPRADALLPGAGKAEPMANQVRQWLSESGLFSEARLLQTSTSAVTPPDLKLALAKVVSALLASQNQGPEQFNRLTPLTSNDLLQAPLQFPRAPTPATPQNTGEPATVGQTLRLLAGMLNRITVNQLHSQTLNARAGAEPGAPVNTLLIEVPWLTPQQEPRTAQLRLEQYSQEKDDNKTPGRSSASEWRLALSMDLDEAGPLHFDVTFRPPSVSALVWAEKQTTLRAVHRELPLLRQSLNDLGLDVADLDCRRGSPGQIQTRLEHRLVDTKA
ncbi:flagellar hook-length control protein FliK [Marinobacter sp. VGCF2001]|uniref:flagellar hook-length control protein FliK n=1 Tax=Marinobacter sp. VGCF2001 TaxID=3417189 RepID=UPI003CF7923A